MNQEEVEKFLKVRNNALYPKDYTEYPREVKSYLEKKYSGKGMSIVTFSHRCNELDVMAYNNRDHYEDILMGKDDIVATKRLFGRMLELFNEETPITRIKDVDGEPMFSNIPRYNSEENIQFYQIVAVGFVLLPGNKFLFLRNNEKHTRLPNLTTMVQGHVESSYLIGSMSSKQYMEYELCRELAEEVCVASGGKELSVFELTRNTSMKKIIYTMVDEVSREHVGALSIVDLRHLEDVSVSSKEESHDVLVGSINDIINAGDIDGWSTIVIDAIVNGKLTFKNNIY